MAGSGLTRRRLLQSAGVAGAGLGAGAVAGYGLASRDEEPAGTGRVRFHGARQAGITTPAQDRLAIGAFDVTATSRDDLRDLLRGVDRSSRAPHGRSSGGPRERPGCGTAG